MNYAKHYNRLIERAATRKLDTYTENHHVIPRCMGGSDTKDNLVALTPEEHYVAHQLLIKMHPKVHSLVHAVHMMTVSGNGHSRNNKRYGWLKRKYSDVCKKRTGTKNSSYGKSWYYNLEQELSKKFADHDVPDGWLPGRVMNFAHRHCKSCEKDMGVDLPNMPKTKYCSDRCRYKVYTDRAKYQVKHTDEEFENLYLEHTKTGRSLRQLASKHGFNQWSVYDYLARYRKKHNFSQ